MLIRRRKLIFFFRKKWEIDIFEEKNGSFSKSSITMPFFGEDNNNNTELNIFYESLLRKINKFMSQL